MIMSVYGLCTVLSEAHERLQGSSREEEEEGGGYEQDTLYELVCDELYAEDEREVDAARVRADLLEGSEEVDAAMKREKAHRSVCIDCYAPVIAAARRRQRAGERREAESTAKRREERIRRRRRRKAEGSSSEEEEETEPTSDDDEDNPEGYERTFTNRLKKRREFRDVLPAAVGKEIEIPEGARMLFKQRTDMDNYDNGPTKEELKRPSPQQNVSYYSKDGYPIINKDGLLVSWGDNGYRIGPGFHLAARIPRWPCAEHVVRSLILPQPNPEAGVDRTFMEIHAAWTEREEKKRREAEAEERQEAKAKRKKAATAAAAAKKAAREAGQAGDVQVTSEREDTDEDEPTHDPSRAPWDPPLIRENRILHPEGYRVVTMEQFRNISARMRGQDEDAIPAVTGRDDNGRLMCIDLKASSVKMKAHELVYAIDLDSVLMVFYFLMVQDVVHVYLTPQPMKFWHNQLHVTIIQPWKDDEKYTSTPLRLCNKTQPIPLNQCPRTLLARVGNFHIYIVFPHMRHKKQDTRFFERNIPMEVLTVFFESVVWEALEIMAHENPHMANHLRVSPDDERRELVLQPEQWKSLQDCMRAVIDIACDEGDGVYPMEAFQGFFLYVDGSGLKMNTTRTITPGMERNTELDAATFVVKALKEFDYEYISDLRNGYVAVDIALTISPNTTARTDRHGPVTGLFHLPSIASSNKQSGARAEMMPSCTSSTHGGLTAQMTGKRRDSSHILKFLYYPQSFDAVRVSAGEVGDPDGKEMFECGDALAKKSGKILRKLEVAKTRQYGVRKEVRCALQVAAYVIAALRLKVSRGKSARRRH